MAPRKKRLHHIAEMAYLSRGPVGDKARLRQILEDRRTLLVRQVEAIKVGHA